MAKKFIAHPPGTQNPDTYRQFVEVQQAIADLEQRIITDLVLGFIVPNFTFAAHGTMFNQTPVSGADIGAAWQKVNSFDTVSSPKRITFDTAQDTWTYENSGVYQVSAELIVSHNESNAGRSFQIRLQDGNITDPGVPIAIGRNQPGSNIAISFLQTIPVGDPNRTFWLEIGNGDVLTNLIYEASSVTISNVGAWIDDVPAIEQRALS